MKRLWQFVAIGSILAIIIILLLYYFTQPIFIAAFLGAWPAFIIALYDRFVNVPLISFDKKNIRKDSLEVINRNGVIWNFLRLSVNNSGFAPAKNCTAELKVLRRPKRNGRNCPAPFDEPKGLKWSGSNPKETRTIPSRKGSAIIDVLLDDTSITPETRLTWYGAKEWGPLTLWVATNDVYIASPIKKSPRCALPR